MHEARFVRFGTGKAHLGVASHALQVFIETFGFACWHLPPDSYCYRRDTIPHKKSSDNQPELADTQADFARWRSIRGGKISYCKLGGSFPSSGDHCKLSLEAAPGRQINRKTKGSVSVACPLAIMAFILVSHYAGERPTIRRHVGNTEGVCPASSFRSRAAWMPMRMSVPPRPWLRARSALPV